MLFFTMSFPTNCSRKPFSQAWTTNFHGTRDLIRISCFIIEGVLLLSMTRMTRYWTIKSPCSTYRVEHVSGLFVRLLSMIISPSWLTWILSMDWMSGQLPRLVFKCWWFSNWSYSWRRKKKDWMPWSLIWMFNSQSWRWCLRLRLHHPHQIHGKEVNKCRHSLTETTLHLQLLSLFFTLNSTRSPTFLPQPMMPEWWTTTTTLSVLIRGETTLTLPTTVSTMSATTTPSRVMHTRPPWVAHLRREEETMVSRVETMEACPWIL